MCKKAIAFEPVDTAITNIVNKSTNKSTNSEGAAASHSELYAIQ
jgi:hypothetical protein